MMIQEPHTTSNTLVPYSLKRYLRSLVHNGYISNDENCELVSINDLSDEYTDNHLASMNLSDIVESTNEFGSELYHLDSVDSTKFAFNSNLESIFDEDIESDEKAHLSSLQPIFNDFESETVKSIEISDDETLMKNEDSNLIESRSDAESNVLLDNTRDDINSKVTVSTSQQTDPICLDLPPRIILQLVQSFVDFDCNEENLISKEDAMKAVEKCGLLSDENKATFEFGEMVSWSNYFNICARLYTLKTESVSGKDL